MDSVPVRPKLELATIPARRKLFDQWFGKLCLLALLVACVMLIVLLFSVVRDGMGRLNLGFLANPDSKRAAKAGLYPALMGSLYIVLLTAAASVPIGVAAAVFLEEFYRKKSKFKDFVQLNVANLAGVPSIIFGLLGLGLFVRSLYMGPSLLAGSLTMTMLVLPTIILVSQESLRAVPNSLREGSLALGATRWQTIKGQVLPAALPSIYTGIILSLSRAIGETAPLITVGAVAYAKSAPDGLTDRFTVLPIQIYNWIGNPKQEFKELASAGIMVLLVVLLSLNAIAILLRTRTQQKR
jgi:phosphate transport system permease protein